MLARGSGPRDSQGGDVRLLQRAAYWAFEFCLHLVEFTRVVLEERHEQAGAVPRRSSGPRDTSCYPHHHRLRPEQLVSEDDF
jgi:hypothetical protein